MQQQPEYIIVPEQAKNIQQTQEQLQINAGLLKEHYEDLDELIKNKNSIPIEKTEGAIYKYILENPISPSENPNSVFGMAPPINSTYLIKYQTYNSQGKCLNYHQRNNALKVKLFGTKGYFIGIHLVLQSMEIGEQALAYIPHQYQKAIGDLSENSISTDVFICKIKVINIKFPPKPDELNLHIDENLPEDEYQDKLKKQSYENFNYHMILYEQEKNQAQKLFQEKDFKQALKLYTKCFNEIHNMSRTILNFIYQDEQKNQERNQFMIKCLQNCLVCSSKINFKDSSFESNLQKLNDLDPTNKKYFYFGIKYYLNNSYWDKAQDLIIEARKVYPQDKQFSDLQKEFMQNKPKQKAIPKGFLNNGSYQELGQKEDLQNFANLIKTQKKTLIPKLIQDEEKQNKIKIEKYEEDKKLVEKLKPGKGFTCTVDQLNEILENSDGDDIFDLNQSQEEDQDEQSDDL
ncbi:hypothetical protein PPERSA_02495 [Pseudocohnilembus persalinus]|uniref:Peptidylprolyl isomerase n=1 Tax=Pseudocohnilembus persalinus TaxID=266149 RepID=A0A0V0QBC4_PSEPJ|nr:hypothetical protein PPERSA_02495 [Pseudocohnilembus persalinus]|eukprot:KRW99383.1 hypothetical protein PPERSA_02495 [Pseudocohnilembus persalinus]